MAKQGEEKSETICLFLTECMIIKNLNKKTTRGIFLKFLNIKPISDGNVTILHTFTFKFVSNYPKIFKLVCSLGGVLNEMALYTE